jgi:hypothetical protein
MIGSIIWLVLDFVSLSAILDWPLQLAYLVMEKTAAIAGYVPGIHDPNPALIITLSVILSLLIIVFEHRRKTSLLRLQPFS